MDDLKRLSKRKLIQMIVDRDEQIGALEARLSNIERVLSWSKKDSSTSSKPPSSDIVKPPKPPPKKGSKKKRKIGGQPGHPKHERKPLPPEEVDGAFEYSLCECGKCGGALKGSALAPQLFQQVELTGRPIEVSDHWMEWFWCPTCKASQHADLPEVLRKSGLFGPRMRAFVAYLKGAGHMSYTTIQALLRDVYGIRSSTGYLTKVVQQTSGALAVPYAELSGALAGEPWLNVDETGHKDSGERHWTWCFRARAYTVFKVDRSRRSGVLKDVLGEVFGGVLGAGYYSAYHKYMADCDVLVQFCLAHLIRDVRYQTTLADKVTEELRAAHAGCAEATLQDPPSPRQDVVGAVRQAHGAGQGNSDQEGALGAAAIRSAEYGRANSRQQRILLSVHHDARSGANQQFG